MVMTTRYRHAQTLARRIDAARGRLRAAADDALKPDEYREKHGRCPDGYEYDPLSDKCEPKDAEPEEPSDEEARDEDVADEKPKKKGKKEPPKEPPPRPPSPKTPGDWLDGRQERGDYLEKLFHDDPELYQQEADRMRESGELPDRETAKLLVKIKDVEDLPPEVLNDKEELAKIIAQQENQRRIEEMVLEGAEQELKDLEKQRERAIKAGKKPPKLDPFKFLQDVEQKYNRDLLGDSKEIEKILDDESDNFAKIVSDSATKPGEPAYWWKKWWEKVTKPIPTWTPFESGSAADLGLDRLVGGSVQESDVLTTAITKAIKQGPFVIDPARQPQVVVDNASVVTAARPVRLTAYQLDLLGWIAQEGPLEANRVWEAHPAYRKSTLALSGKGLIRMEMDRKTWSGQYHVTDAGRALLQKKGYTKAATSPGVTNMEPREIGFPPYDRDRQPRKHIADQPSGRPAFPPYREVETVEYRDRDARMQGFPPYDGKGVPHDSETVGLPPYNGKAPHVGRGFPPYHDGESVYEQRRRTVDLAVK